MQIEKKRLLYQSIEQTFLVKFNTIKNACKFKLTNFVIERWCTKQLLKSCFSFGRKESKKRTTVNSILKMILFCNHFTQLL